MKLTWCDFGAVRIMLLTSKLAVPVTALDSSVTVVRNIGISLLLGIGKTGRELALAGLTSERSILVSTC